MNTSSVCARQRTRPNSGISSPLSPNGWPLPSQCSSSARIACAVSSGSSSMRAMSAPRSQRVPISSRVTSSSCVMRRIWRALAIGPPPAATERQV